MTVRLRGRRRRLALAALAVAALFAGPAGASQSSDPFPAGACVRSTLIDPRPICVVVDPRP